MAARITALQAGWLLFIVYLIGFIGFCLPLTASWMQKLIWVNLVFTMVILLFFHKKWNREFVLSALLVGACGYLLEVIGVQTGLIFGHYNYGDALGFSIWSTPLMMMVNWFTTVYICRQIAEMMVKEPLMVSVMAALCMLILDYFMEPFAIRQGMWTWNSGTVPMQNYLAWFLAGFLFQYLFIKAVKFPVNKMSLPVYLIQLAFFIAYFLLNT